MCGIVGAVAGRNVVPVLLEGLKRLEYRGYDSAGVAVVNGTLKRARSTGRVAELDRLVAAQGMNGCLGIAHTRWATHGVPSERNAHPHVSGSISVVHNGIIENHEPIRRRLLERGYRFSSDTDSEVIAHLLHDHLRGGATLLEALRRTTGELVGTFAIAVIDADHPDRLAVARMGAPLLLGLGDRENFAASDVAALIQATRRIVYLEDGDCAEIAQDGVRIIDRDGRNADRTEHLSDMSAAAVELGDYRHFMQKEIFEQPLAVANTLEMVAGARSVPPQLFGAEAEDILRRITSVHIAACGTSFHAGLVARYWLEAIARIPARVEIASEYRYRESVSDPDGLFLVISQSGETADTLAAHEHARRLGYRSTLAICNVAESSLIRAATLRFLTRAGPEIGVASTKAFTTQLTALVLLVMVIAKLRGTLTPERESELMTSLRHLPAAMQNVLHGEPDVIPWARRFAERHHALFLGRGVHWPIAMEGALKLKEISYVHAEAYASGELKHGPLALVDKYMPVAVVAPNDALLEKLNSNLQEVRARGGKLYVFADPDVRMAESDDLRILRLPDRAGTLSPILHVIPLQLLAYHAALERGNDVDKPRNLAKSVTVE
jgi:glucosamine--fructose-6-phosphate aminotransferase (isomerizing)